MKLKYYYPIALGMCINQGVTAAETVLGSYGETQLQQNTGDLVKNTCVGFISIGTSPGVVPLFDTCAAVVQTANELSGEGPVVNSLGLTTDQLADALQQIANEEYAVTGSIANEISSSRFDPVVSRLTNLRTGPQSFTLSGLNINNSATLLSSDANGINKGAGAGDEWMNNRLSGFANINIGAGDKESTENTNAFDYDNYRLTAGVDYRLNNNLVFGGALSYNQTETEFDNSATVSGGNLDTDGWGGALYGSFSHDHYYFDSLISYSASEYDIERNIVIPSNNPAIAPINDTALSTTDSNDYSFSIGGGYTFNQGPLSFGPYGRATYMRVDIDRYQEYGADTSGLNFDVAEQEWTSLSSVLGAEFSYAISRQQAVFIPQARLGWVHQFENDETEITATYVNDPLNNTLRYYTDEPDRDYFELSLSISSVWTHGVQVFANYDTLLGFENLTDHQFTLGGRWEY
jgi:outer membrane autotransporter protein